MADEASLPDRAPFPACTVHRATGRVFDIQRFSIHDGPGIRTTVFLKGCPLRCLWCHNPEGMAPQPAISFRAESCIGCGECVRSCPHHAHQFEVRSTDGPTTVHRYDRDRCEVCGSCASACPARGLELVGRETTVEEVLREVLADRVFYESSGGGLTISGGEPLMQIEFTVALLDATKQNGLHCCLETCGFGPWDHLRRLLPLVDLFLYDFKEGDASRHADFTGQSNRIILDNLRLLCDRGAKVQLQCPIIPGCNDSAEHMAGIAELARELSCLDGVRLLPFHSLGSSKWQRFGLSPPQTYPRSSLDRAQLADWASWLQGRGVRVLNT